MTAVINGSSPTVTFSDGTTQATSAIVSGYVPYTNLPSGSVLQVVNSASTTQISTTSTSLVATGFTASITPKFATSKVIVLVTLAGIYINATGKEANFHIYKNGSTMAQVGDLYITGGNIINTQSYTYLDSPATTSATTYSIYYQINSGATLAVNSSAGQVSSITLLEIAA